MSIMFLTYLTGVSVQLTVLLCIVSIVLLITAFLFFLEYTSCKKTNKPDDINKERKLTVKFLLSAFVVMFICALIPQPKTIEKMIEIKTTSSLTQQDRLVIINHQN